jgi:hypothetical protein
MTDEQLERGIALIKEMLAKRAAGAGKGASGMAAYCSRRRHFL